MRRGKVKQFWQRPEVVPFVKAIRVAPEDDLPRLVFADWLEDTCDPLNTLHAHFIRWQIEQHRRGWGERCGFGYFEEYYPSDLIPKLRGRLSHGFRDHQESSGPPLGCAYMLDVNHECRPLPCLIQRGMMSVVEGDEQDLAQIIDRLRNQRQPFYHLFASHPMRFVLTELRRGTEAFTYSANPFDRTIDITYNHKTKSVGVELMDEAVRKHPRMTPGAALLMLTLGMGLCDQHHLLPVVTVCPDLCEALASNRSSARRTYISPDLLDGDSIGSAHMPAGSVRRPGSILHAF